MRVTFWGTRGSIASPGPATQGYGGNTACVQVSAEDGTCLILDAGTGIRALGDALPKDVPRIDILLSHLHMDHIQGLGFFAPFFREDFEVHVWGPPSTTQGLRERLTRYLSPPLFPVRLRDVESDLQLHNAPAEPTRIGAFVVTAATIIHPGPTVGYRIDENGRSMAYLSDHEPALGVGKFPDAPAWTSGHDIAAGVDVLVHDGQFSQDERAGKIGWGHSSTVEAAEFARQARARRLVCFHHDPSHDDEAVDRLIEEASAVADGVLVSGAREGVSLQV